MLIKIVAVVISLTLLVGMAACSQERKEEFGIYLADTGELVLSERHIKAYHSDDNALELNTFGLKRWNSYMEYEDIPKLYNCLFARDFILKIDGKEICTGKFWSMVSSASYQGVVIMESLFKLDNEHNCLWIKSHFSGHNLDPYLKSELEQFFREQNKLK